MSTNHPIPTPDSAADATHTATPAEPAPPNSSLSPRTSPIVWGCLILAFCAYVVQRTLAPESINSVAWITGTLFGLGALLLGVGIAIVARNRRDQTGASHK